MASRLRAPSFRFGLVRDRGITQRVIRQDLAGNEFDLTRYLLHGSAHLTDSDPLTVVTPAPQWAYALEFPRAPESEYEGPVVVDLTLRVLDGAVGVGALASDGRLLVEVERTPADGESDVDLAIPSLIGCQSLIVRNT